MASNRLKRKNIIQLILSTLGILLIFLIYFSLPNKNVEKNETDSDVLTTNNEYKENKDVNIFENLEYKGTLNDGNKFVIFSKYSEFNRGKPEIINMKNVLCYFYFKDGTSLEIVSESGIYNNVTLDISFSKNVSMFYMDNALFSDNAEFSNENNLLNVHGNVRTLGPEGEIVADKLNFDFSDKKLNISMYSDEKIKIKTKLK